MTEETTSVAEVGGSTPLDAILGNGASSLPPTDVPSQESVSDQTQADPADDADDGGPMVSLVALHRERDRRQKMDARVRELEEEIQRYHEQKWGVEQPPAEATPDTGNQEQERDRQAFAYNQSYASFLAKHGKDKVAAIDAAVNSLPAPQKAHVLSLVTQGEGDPVERVFQYVQQLGVLDEGFKPTSLQDALAGKQKEPPSTDNRKLDQVLARLEERERAIGASERATTFNASRIEFVSEFGKGNFDKLDAATQSLLTSGHPVAAEFSAMVTRSANPVATAAELLGKLGLWTPEEQRQIAPSVMPSNFATVRSVGGRKGPAYAGPTPLSDIFKR